MEQLLLVQIIRLVQIVSTCRETCRLFKAIRENLEIWRGGQQHWEQVENETCTPGFELCFTLLDKSISTCWRKNCESSAPVSLAPLNKFARRGQNLLARKMGHRGLLTIRERGDKERERERGGDRKKRSWERKKGKRRRRKVSLKVTGRAV